MLFEKRPYRHEFRNVGNSEVQGQLAQLVETSCVPIKDVPFLPMTEERRRIHTIHGHCDSFRPVHLVGAEH